LKFNHRLSLRKVEKEGEYKQEEKPITAEIGDNENKKENQ
jgi:hypothetical protein